MSCNGPATSTFTSVMHVWTCFLFGNVLVTCHLISCRNSERELYTYRHIEYDTRERGRGWFHYSATFSPAASGDICGSGGGVGVGSDALSNKSVTEGEMAPRSKRRRREVERTSNAYASTTSSCDSAVHHQNLRSG